MREVTGILEVWNRRNDVFVMTLDRFGQANDVPIEDSLERMINLFEEKRDWYNW